MTDEAIIAYLLKELPEAALERFEDECFAQETWPAQLSLVEEDLIEDYLRHQLSPERRQRFEENYLTTDARQERVSLTAALLRLIDERCAAASTLVVEPEPQPSMLERLRFFWRGQSRAFQTVTALALIALFSGSLWLLFLRPRAPRSFAALTLTISTNNRAEGAQAGTVKLSADLAGLNLALTLPRQSPAASGYRVELENDNAEAKSVELTGHDAQSVMVRVPASQLARGQYVLKLFAVKADGSEQRINGSYYFIVE
jgi:hypothetical protein